LVAGCLNEQIFSCDVFDGGFMAGIFTEHMVLGNRARSYHAGRGWELYRLTDNPNILTVCAYKRVNFNAVDMGAERTKAALSMAMSAFISGKQFGVVVDLPTQGAVCTASPSSTQGAGIK